MDFKLNDQREVSVQILMKLNEDHEAYFMHSIFFLHIKMKNKLNKLNFDTNDLFYKEAS